ncbi:MAG: hypothetical protein IPN29_11320 [Saprospiraceae bacterium]|nr:hypothetical protein [Saprospiraceae bacterium]
MTIELKNLFDIKEGLNEKMVNIILQSIKNSHDSGMDFIKFKQSIQNLMAMNMDEVTAVKSAYATASTMGMNKENLIKSINSYQAIVDDERDKFINTLKKQIEAQVEAPQSEIQVLDGKIAANQSKIENLMAEIEAYKAQIEATKSEVASSEDKIDKTRKEFLSVYECFSESLQEDKKHFEGLL